MLQLRMMLGVLVLLGVTLAYSHGHAAGKGSNPNGKPFVELQGQIIEVEGELSSIQDQIDAIVAQVSTIEDRVGANEAAITLLQNQNATLQAQIDASAADITSLENEIAALVAENASLQDQINTLGDADGALQAQIDANETNITTLAQTIDTLEGNLQAQIDNNYALIGALDTEIVAINASLALKQQIINGQCPVGYAIRAVNSDGSVVCEFDNQGTIANIARTVVSNERGVLVGQESSISVSCPAGWTVTGGGHHGFSTEMRDSWPAGNGWFVTARNTANFDLHLIVFANCIRLN